MARMFSWFGDRKLAMFYFRKSSEVPLCSRGITKYDVNLVSKFCDLIIMVLYFSSRPATLLCKPLFGILGMLRIIQSNPFIRSPSIQGVTGNWAKALNTYLLLKNSSADFLLLLVEGL